MTKEELYRELVKQKMEMTPDERMKAYMAGEEVDCIPHRLLSADDALGVAWGYSKHDLYNNLDVRAAQLRKKQKLYGDASIPFKLGLRGMGIALGSEEIVSDRGENDIGRRFLDSYDKLYILEEFEVESNPWMQKKIETVREMKQRLPELKYSGGMAGPITTAIAMRPIEYVLRDMRKAPKELHRLLELIVVCNLKYVRAGYEQAWNYILVDFRSCYNYRYSGGAVFQRIFQTISEDASRWHCSYYRIGTYDSYLRTQ